MSQNRVLHGSPVFIWRVQNKEVPYPSHDLFPPPKCFVPSASGPSCAVATPPPPSSRQRPDSLPNNGLNISELWASQQVRFKRIKRIGYPGVKYLGPGKAWAWFNGMSLKARSRFIALFKSKIAKKKHTSAASKHDTSCWYSSSKNTYSFPPEMPMRLQKLQQCFPRWELQSLGQEWNGWLSCLRSQSKKTWRAAFCAAVHCECRTEICFASLLEAQSVASNWIEERKRKQDAAHEPECSHVC